MAPRRRKRYGARLRWVGSYLRNALAGTGLLLVIYHACFHLSVVVSGSMAPTLQGDDATPRDWILSERVSYWFREPRRWEIVKFWTADHMLVAKRIVGMPGEQIAVRDGSAIINHARVQPPEVLRFLHYFAGGRLDEGQSTECGGGYFLLGDDSKDSYDSRFNGPVDREAFVGRVWLIVWPPSRMGWVH